MCQASGLRCFSHAELYLASYSSVLSCWLIDRLSIVGGHPRTVLLSLLQWNIYDLISFFGCPFSSVAGAGGEKLATFTQAGTEWSTLRKKGNGSVKSIYFFRSLWYPLPLPCLRTPTWVGYADLCVCSFLCILYFVFVRLPLATPLLPPPLPSPKYPPSQR